VRSEQALRDRTDRAGRLDAPTDATPDDPAELAMAGAVAHIDRGRVSDALERLTPLQRQAIDLAYFGACTQTEIAEILGVPLGTVKTRVRDGLIRLRDELGATV
jgi:RNA polymerase sigma-70 factor (ECF subfamily)